ncbi:nuclease-related domain-containing protein [Leeuwenhoekiella palythoae]|uniref:nuclease-related domain-containing protein n=1 Tax=Leeuwenhoekiella palythoae TaxID=573501 RepID=UPI0035188D02
MAQVIGIIESFKALKHELNNNKINRFNSIEEVEAFLTGYDLEKQSILENTKDQLAREYLERLSELKEAKLEKEEHIRIETDNFLFEINNLTNRVDVLKHANGTNFFKRIWIAIEYYFKEKRLLYLKNNRFELIDRSVREITQRIENHNLFIHRYTNDLECLIQEYALTKILELEHINDTLNQLRNLVAGAIGENLVVQELEKLSDNFVLINDFRLNFDPPLYYRKTNSRIYSIQIDHLLISRAGIFCIETKNWSNSSINTLDLRSPVEQIQRSGFAMFLYTSKNISIKNHHWGEQKIPVRNVIVMINNKPQESFKFVTIKQLEEMNDYLNYFDPILSQNQFSSLITHFS